MPAPGTSFAALFEQLRLAKGWSPAEVSRRLDVSPTQVSRWRKGSGVPAIQTLQTISALFGVDHETLEMLAGYRANTVDSEQATADPEVNALLEADREAIRQEFAGIPTVFWKPIIDARRVAGQLAVDNVRAVMEIAKNQPISSQADQVISSPTEQQPTSKERGENSGTDQTLTRPFGAYSRREHSANRLGRALSLSAIDRR